MSTTTQQPTPETDDKQLHVSDAASEYANGKQTWRVVIPFEFSRKLERQRDEAREQLEAMREAIKEAYEAIKAVPLEYDARFFRAGKWSEVALTKLKPFLKP